MNKQDIKEVIERWRDFAYYFYYTKEGGDIFKAEQENNPFCENGRKFTISLDDSGLFCIKLFDSNEFALVNCQFKICPPSSESKLDNAIFDAEIVNKADLSDENFKFFDRIKIFCGSFFQRLIVMQFFVRMQPSTIDSYAQSLSSAEKPQN